MDDDDDKTEDEAYIPAEIWGCRREDLNTDDKRDIKEEFGVIADTNGDMMFLDPEKVALFVMVNNKGHTLSRINCHVSYAIHGLRAIADALELEAISNGGELDLDRWKNEAKPQPPNEN